ncbi:AI-2E family transporter [Rhodopila sp.]|uniref:AI-2E family transporter n=1 Tax=Rhodopila sp. TaxID=2480087 RepID=UPI003D12DA28
MALPLIMYEAERMADDSGPAERRPAVVTAAETPGLSGLLTLAVAVVVVAGLYLGRTVLIPITLAVLLSFLLAPIVNLLRRIHLGRVLSVIVAVLLALTVILALGGLIGIQIAGLAQDVPKYASTIRTKLDTVQGFATSRLNLVMRGLGQPVETRSQMQPKTPNAGGQQKPMQVEVQQPEPTPMQIAERVIAPIVDPLSTTAIVVIVAIFVLLQREDLRDRLIRLFGSSDLHRTTAAMNDAARRLSRYFLTQLGINAAFGVITGTGLLLIGVPSPLLWGIIGLLLRFVPYIGAPLAAVLPLALAAAVSPGWSMVAWTGGLYVVTEAVMGQVVEPLLYGHSTGLSPFSVVVSATFWTWLWGPIGLILSTPLTLCLVVLGRHVERLEFLDVILGDRPALTPVESFYQRMLAGDPDEARDQAEVLLRERPLSSYYDEVALKGLQLAANDAARGVLTEVQLGKIKSSMQELIDDLDEHDDKDPDAKESLEGASAALSRSEQDLPRHPPPGKVAEDALAPGWRGGAPVLCIAGRGVLDEAAASMLSQLLHKSGLKARVLQHEAASRLRIGSLDGEGVSMVCLCYLDLDGTPSHLRYMLRRLRQRLPAAKLLVGLWPVEQAILTDDRLRAAVGADVYISSLREAVEACLEAARTEVQPIAA